MKASELEVRARQIIARVIAGQPVEDMLFELKSQWPEPPNDAARQLAGAANAARGEPILWLLGVHEKRREITGVKERELSSWYDQIVKEFDDRVAPRLPQNVNIHYDSMTVVALLFDPHRPPYVVNNPSKGQQGSDDRRIAREIPWREGNSIRTARRHEILEILVPAELVPEYEIIDVSLTQRQPVNLPPYPAEGAMDLVTTLYIKPKTERRIVFPFHHCKASIRATSHRQSVSMELRVTSISSPTANSLTVQNSASEVIVVGPGMIRIMAEAQGLDIPQAAFDIEVVIRIGIVHASSDVVISGTLSDATDAICAHGGRAPGWRWKPLA